MERELASIKRFFYDRWPVRIYSTTIPIEIETPSLYFPPPSQNSSLASKLAYETFQILRVGVYEATRELAYKKAFELSEAVRANRFSIPLVNPDGSISTELLHVESIDVESVDDSEAQITISFPIITNFN